MKKSIFTTALFSLLLLCGGVAKGQMVQQLTNTPEEYINCCSHPAANLLYLGGIQGIYLSTDNGETWTMVHEYDSTVHIPQSMDDTIYSIPFFYMNFMDANTGFATKTRNLKCGYAFDWLTVHDHPARIDSPGLFKTSDGGVTWEMVDSSHYFINIQFAGQDTVYAYEKADKTLYKSVNGGVDWEMVFNSIDIDDYSVVNGNVVYVMKKAGYIEDYFEPMDPVTPTVYKSSDGGNTWTMLLSNGKDSPKAPVCLDIIHFHEEGKGVLMGNKQIFTEDDFTSYYWQGSGFTYVPYVAEDIQSYYLKTGHTVSTCSSYEHTPADAIKLRVSRDFGHHASCQELTCSFLGVNSITGCEEDTTFYVSVANQVDGQTSLYRIKGSDFPPVGVEEYEQGYNVTVAPNPVTDKCYIRSESPIRDVWVYDMLGKEQGSFHFDGTVDEVKMSASLWKDGVYVLRIATEKGVIMKKIIKK